MNRHTLLSFLAVFFIVIALPVYASLEPVRMDGAQTALRQAFVNDAAVRYVENCAVCHGAAGEGIGATPALDHDGLRTADYDTLFKVIARGRYETAMAGWHINEGGVYTDYDIDALIALIRYVNWADVGELAAAQGLIPPTLPVPEIDAAQLAQVAALGDAGDSWAAGMQLYANGCTVCHGVNGEGSDLGVPLNTPDVRARETTELTRIILEGVPGTMMAGWGSALTADEVANLAAFLQNWDRVTAAGVELTPPAPLRIDLDNPADVLALGQRIFDTTCASCHGENGSGGTGPALNSQQVLSRQSNDQMMQTIINGGHRPNSAMPAFGDRMTLVEIAAVVDYIRAWEPTAPRVENPRGTAQGGGPPWQRTPSDDGGAISPQGGGPGAGQGQGGPSWRESGSPPGQRHAAPGQQAGDAVPASGDVLSYRGVVVSVTGNQLTLRTEAGDLLQAMLGPPWFWDANGIALAPGDVITLEGFESPDHMELNWLQNETTGDRIHLRTPTGQPTWGGGE